jgi:hypothetical protein
MDEFKNEIKIPFTMVPNGILQDPNLSLKQKGMMCYLISLPNGWKIYKTELEKHFTDGRESISNAIEDLVNLGFIDKVEKPKDQGKFSGFTYTVKPLRENRYGLSATDNPSLINTYREKTKRKKKDINITDSEESVPKPLTLYQLMIEYWLKVYHPDWTFGATHGKKIKSLITKFKKILVAGNFEDNDTNVLELFKSMCQNMPEYYRDKDLSVIDSKFNEITTEIIKTKNGKRTANNQSKPIEQYSPFTTGN